MNELLARGRRGVSPGPVLRAPGSRRLSATAAVVGVALGFTLAVFGPGGTLLHGNARHVAAPAGFGATLTPPSTWCTVTQVPGGVEYDCGPGGSLQIPLHVTSPSRMAGAIRVSGPFAVWIFASALECEVLEGLTRALGSCAPPLNVSWATWTTNYSAAATADVSTFPVDLTAGPGIVPVGDWTMLIADSASSNESASVVAPILLESP